ncbi:unnamed protein product, partial [Linum tenue]
VPPGIRSHTPRVLFLVHFDGATKGSVGGRSWLRWFYRANAVHFAFGKVVIQMINRKDLGYVLGGSLLSEIQVLLVSVQRASFYFTLRKFNRTAHIMAKQALSLLDRWLVGHRLFFNYSL